jgi:hypothetical protein
MKIARLLLPLLAAGCSSSFEVWLLQIGVIELEKTDSIDENFVDAEAPDGDDILGDWEYTDESELSDRLLTAQVYKGKKGQLVLVADGMTYPGVEDKGAWTFEWTGSTEATYGEDHVSGYSYSMVESSESKVTIKLDKVKETKGRSGNWTESTVQDLTYRESDEWDHNATGYPAGQIPALAWLTGPGVINQPGVEECSSTPCTLSVVSEESGSAPVKAQYMGNSDDAGYGAVNNAGVANGSF